jgi:hypothetical protein
MIAAATERTANTGLPLAFQVGDAHQLDLLIRASTESVPRWFSFTWKTRSLCSERWCASRDPAAAL